MSKAIYERLGREPKIFYRIPGYIVRNYSPDLEESVIHHISTNFLLDEPFCKSSKLASDPVSLKEVTDWWRGVLKQNLAVIALREDSPGADLKPIKENCIELAGLNVLFVASVDDPPSRPAEEMFSGDATRRFIGIYMKLSNMVNVFERHGVTQYMDAAGFSVHREERGHGLGAALLEARFCMCHELGLKATKTVFSSIPAQKVALRCGMEPVVEVFFDDMRDEVTGDLLFPGIPPNNKALVTVKTF